MPRLFGKLRRRHEPEAVKDNLTAHAQRIVLAHVVRRATQQPTHHAAERLFGRLAFTGLQHINLNKTWFRKEKDTRPYVVVIGAGFAGLAAAYELAISGQYNVVVLEANSRVGGRVWTVEQNNFENTIKETTHEYNTVERGGELIGLNHFTWLHYVDRFDLHLDYLEPPSPDKGEEHPEAVTPTERMYEYMKVICHEIDAAAARLELFTDEHVTKAPWETTDAAKLDGLSLEAGLNEIAAKYVHATLDEVKAEVNSFQLHEFKYSEFQEAMEATKADFENNNGLPCSQQSWYFNLLTIGNGNMNLDPKLLESLFDNIEGIEQAEKPRKLSFWDDAELFRCKEGNMALAVKFHEHLVRAGVEVRCNTTVNEITIKDRHIKIGTNHGLLKLPGKKVTRVVLATAPSVWKDITFHPALPRELAVEPPKLGYLVKYLFEVSPEVTEEFRRLEGSEHTKWAMVWEAAKNETSDGASTRVENTLAAFAGGESAYILAKPPGSDEVGVDAARRAYVVQNLNKMRPTGMEYEFKAEDIIQDVFMDWPHNQFVHAGYSCPTMNEVVRLGPIIHSPIHERLHLAGEYACRYQWCGFMEGALLSGAGVAKDVLNRSEDDAKRARPQK